MRIAFITDVHVGPQASYGGKLRKMSHLALPLTQRFVEQMKRSFRPDLVVNLGDVIEDESYEADLRNYSRFVELLHPCGSPVVHVAGNHDQENLSQDDLRRAWNHSGNLFYSRNYERLHIAVLRTDHTAEGVHLEPAQIEWLRQDLARTDLPSLVFCHHPLCEQDVGDNRWFYNQPQICRVAERRSVRELLEQSGKVLAVFNGHVHWNYLSVINRIPYLTLQSMIENVEDDAPGRAAASFAIVDVLERTIQVRIHGEQPAQYQFAR